MRHSKAMLVIICLFLILGTIAMAAANEYFIYIGKTITDTNSDSDVVVQYKAELENIKLDNNEEQKKMDDTVLKFVDVYFNYEGEQIENKEKILSALSDIVITEYLDIISQSFSHKGNNIGKENRQKVKNYCTSEDIFYRCDYKHDGMVRHEYIAVLNESDIYKNYVKIILTKEDNGTYKVENFVVLGGT